MNVQSFEIDNWEEVQTGLVITENEEWLLVKHIPVDYVIDGYKLYKKKFITKRSNDDNGKKIERVLSLKGEDTQIPNGFNFSDTLGLLKWIEEKYGIFEFQDDDETELFYGRINKVIGSTLIIHSIHSDGTVENNYNYEFNLDEIRLITFLSDYFNSIRLLWMDENSIKPTP